MTEVGIYKRQFLIHTTKKPVCRTDILTQQGLNIYETLSILLILVIGMIAAIVILMFEICFAHYF